MAGAAPEARARPRIGRDDIGFLLAKATQRWNEVLAERFRESGHADIRPSYGSILVPLFEVDGLRMGELARRARLSKQTMTQMIRRLEAEHLIERRSDPNDGRASLVYLTARGQALEPVAHRVLGELESLVGERLGPRRTLALKKSLSELLNLE